MRTRTTREHLEAERHSFWGPSPSLPRQGPRLSTARGHLTKGAEQQTSTQPVRGTNAELLRMAALKARAAIRSIAKVLLGTTNDEVLEGREPGAFKNFLNLSEAYPNSGSATHRPRRPKKDRAPLVTPARYS